MKLASYIASKGDLYRQSALRLLRSVDGESVQVVAQTTCLDVPGPLWEVRAAGASFCWSVHPSRKHAFAWCRHMGFRVVRVVGATGSEKVAPCGAQLYR